MSDHLLVFFLMAAAMAFIVGLAKGGLGGTLGALATPMMALVMPADQVIGLVLPVLMVADVFAISLHWKKWNSKHILLLLPGAIVGITIGTFVIIDAPTEVLRRILGIIILLFGLYKLVEKRLFQAIVYQSRNWHGAVAGVIAGFSSSLAHIGSPPVSIYLLMQEVTPEIFIGTSALFFGIVNLIKVPYYIYARQFDWPAVWSIAWLLPLVPLGVVAGKWLSQRVNRQQFERIIIATLMILAAMLLLT